MGPHCYVMNLEIGVTFLPVFMITLISFSAAHPATDILAVPSGGNIDHLSWQNSAHPEGASAERFSLECELMTEDTGSFSSEGSPKYDSNLDQCWIIDTPGKTISLTFNQFQVEDSSACEYDYLGIEDSDGDIYGPYCGTTTVDNLPPTTTTLDDQMVVYFHSDKSMEFAGFSAQYQATINGIAPTVEANCQLITQAETINSENYPRNYDNQYNKCWVFWIEGAEHLELSILSPFEIENHKTCQWDYLEIRDGVNNQAETLLKICGTVVPEKVVSSGNSLYIKFHSDSSVNKRGFRAKIKASSSGDGTGNGGINQNCGHPVITPLATRIVGGKTTNPNSWPWQISLQSSGHICGGSILNDRWIITAAHCVSLPDDSPQPPSKYSVIAGEHNQNNGNEGTEQIIKVKRVIVHEGWNSNTLKHDIALLQLKKSLRMTSAVQPICLPTTSVPDHHVCYTTGWGKTQGTGNNQYLKQVRLPIVPYSQCRSWYGKQVTDHMICAGYEAGGRSACQGDSGGPLACQIYDANLGDDVFTLHGVTSWGQAPCARRKEPTVYTNVQLYTDWIVNKIQTYSPNADIPWDQV